MGEYRSTRGEKPPETSGEKRRRAARNVLRVLIVIIAISVASIYIQVPRRVPASGYATTAPYAEVRAPLTGVIVSISAFSGDKVEEGDVLLPLQVSEQQDEELLPGPVPGGDARGAEELVGDLLRVLPQDLEPAVEMAVKGHAGNHKNEECDKMAVNEIKKYKDSLCLK